MKANLQSTTAKGVPLAGVSSMLSGWLITSVNIPERVQFPALANSTLLAYVVFNKILKIKIVVFPPKSKI